MDILHQILFLHRVLPDAIPIESLRYSLSYNIIIQSFDLMFFQFPSGFKDSIKILSGQWKFSTSSGLFVLKSL